MYVYNYCARGLLIMKSFNSPEERVCTSWRAHKIFDFGATNTFVCQLGDSLEEVDPLID